MNIKKTRFYKLIFILFFLGCGGEEYSYDPKDSPYYPLEVGMYNVYDFDSVVFTEFGDTIRLSFLLREEVISHFRDNEQRDQFFIEVFIRENEQALWEHYDEYYLFADEYQVIKQRYGNETNILTFPPKKGAIWNSQDTTKNTSSQEFTYLAVEEQDSVNAIFFENTIHVLEKEEINIIDSVQKIRVYAYGTGVICYKNTSLNTQPGTPSAGYSNILTFRYRSKRQGI